MEDDKPWYKQFWPWFVFALPAIAVIAGITTVIIAMDHRPVVVPHADAFKGPVKTRPAKSPPRPEKSPAP
jgi:hypothetical protein